MDADGDAKSGDLEGRSSPHPVESEEDDLRFLLLVVCVVVAVLLFLLLCIALSLCLYRRRHRLNWFQNDLIETKTDRLRSLTTGSSSLRSSSSAAAPTHAPTHAPTFDDGNNTSEQTGNRLIPKFLFSGARSTNQNATGSGYGTILASSAHAPGIGFPVPTKVSYVLLSNKSVESPESTPTSPEVDPAVRPSSTDPNTRFRNRSTVTGSQPRTFPLSAVVSASSSHRTKVMGTLASRGSNPSSAPSGTVASSSSSSPCRIVVDAVVTSDDPPLNSDLKSFVDPSVGAAGSAESRRSSYSSVAGSGVGVGEDSASRRGSMSPRERSSIPFLWTLGPSNSAPSVAKGEDGFWVPPNVLLKKRANSLAPPSLTITADVDSSTSHNGKPPRRSESVGRGVNGGSGGGGGVGGGGGCGQSNSARDMSVTCSSTERLSEMWPSSGDWTTSGQLQQQRRRRASMQDALDFTKIDASLYERPPPLSSQKLFGSVQEENLGSVHFSLTYDADLSVLTVRLMQAMDLSLPSATGWAPQPPPLPSSTGGGPTVVVVVGSGDSSSPPRSLLNPFARLRLLPDERNVLQSRVHPKTLCPQFEEEFVFEATPVDLPNRTLELMLINDEHGSAHRGGAAPSLACGAGSGAGAGGSAGTEDDEGCFGHVLLPLDQVDFTEPTTFLKGISAYERKPQPESYLGDIMFSLSYLPSAERMTVVIVKARHLKQADLCATRPPPLNPFVKVAVFTDGKKAKKKKTTTKRGSASPEWNEALVFGVTKDQLGGVQLELLVLSENLLGTDDPIGKVMLGTRSTGEDHAHWNDFLNGRPGTCRWHRLTPMDA